MKRNVPAYAVLALLCAGYLIFIAATMSLLPERAAMHFGANGQADNWMTRAAAVTFFVIMGFATVGVFVVLSLVLQWMPNWTFNLPHRDYWLAPERRAETIAFISRQLIWIGCGMVFFFAGIYWLTILANRHTPAHLPMELFLPMLICFLLALSVWVIAFFRRFGKPPA